MRVRGRVRGLYGNTVLPGVTAVTRPRRRGCSLPPSAVIVPSRRPSQPLQRLRDALLFARPQAVGIEAQRHLGRLRHRASRPWRQQLAFLVDARVACPIGQQVLPFVHHEPRFLLRRDELPLEVALRPPFLAGPECGHRLGKQLVPVTGQRIGIDGPHLQGPEAPAAGFVLQVTRLIGCADEQALARRDHLFPGHTAAGNARRCGL